MSKKILRAAAPELLTRRLTIGDFFELRLKHPPAGTLTADKEKAHRAAAHELSSVLVYLPVIPLGFRSVDLGTRFWPYLYSFSGRGWIFGYHDKLLIPAGSHIEPRSETFINKKTPTFDRSFLCDPAGLSFGGHTIKTPAVSIFVFWKKSDFWSSR